MCFLPWYSPTTIYGVPALKVVLSNDTPSSAENIYFKFWPNNDWTYTPAIFGKRSFFSVPKTRRRHEARCRRAEITVPCVNKTHADDSTSQSSSTYASSACFQQRFLTYHKDAQEHHAGDGSVIAGRLQFSRTDGGIVQRRWCLGRYFRTHSDADLVRVLSALSWCAQQQHSRPNKKQAITIKRKNRAEIYG